MVETEGEQFSLRWNNFHSNLTAGFHALLQGEDLVDVTLAAAGQFVQAHKIVLSVCSPYFKELFKVNPCKHPIVILKDVGHKELVAILQFMYQGEVNVRQEELATFLKTAEMLQIKGLTGDDSPATNTPSVPDSSERTTTSRTQQPSLLEPLVVQSEDPPSRPYKRKRSEAPAPPPPTQASVSSPCVVNDDSNIIEVVEMSKPKVEPVEYESDVEEVVDKLPNQDDPLAQLLGGESSSHSHQDSVQGTSAIYASISGLSHDSGGSQDGGQDPGQSVATGIEMEDCACHICGKVLRRTSLRRHIVDRHYPSQQAPCKLCGKVFKTANSLSTHMNAFHRHFRKLPAASSQT